METEDKSSVEEVLPKLFEYHHDAGHGWLAGPYSTIVSFGIKNQISAYSYRKSETVYLEEDQDAGIFIKAYLENKGKAPSDFKFFHSLCASFYDGHSSEIRNYHSFKKS